MVLGHMARLGGPASLDPATAPGGVPPSGVCTVSATLLPLAFARCLRASGASRPVRALGIAPNSGLHDRWFDPRRPGFDGIRPPTPLELMEEGFVTAGRGLWTFLEGWQALLAVLSSCAVFEGLPAGARPRQPDEAYVRALDQVVVGEAPAASRLQLGMLRALKRCILSDIELGGVAGARLHVRWIYTSRIYCFVAPCGSQ